MVSRLGPHARAIRGRVRAWATCAGCSTPPRWGGLRRDPRAAGPALRGPGDAPPAARGAGRARRRHGVDRRQLDRDRRALRRRVVGGGVRRALRRRDALGRGPGRRPGGHARTARPAGGGGGGADRARHRVHPARRDRGPRARVGEPRAGRRPALGRTAPAVRRIHPSSRSNAWRSSPRWCATRPPTSRRLAEVLDTPLGGVRRRDRPRARRPVRRRSISATACSRCIRCRRTRR